MAGYEFLFKELKVAYLTDRVEAGNIMDDIYISALQSSTLDYIRHNSLISQMLTLMAQFHLEKNRYPMRNDIYRIAEYIRFHFAEDIHIEQLMERANLSRHYLIHLFQKQFGVPPYKYLNNCRINHSRFLLQNTDMTVAQIAYAVGYKSDIVFIRHFKEKYNITPGKFRRQK